MFSGLCFLAPIWHWVYWGKIEWWTYSFFGFAQYLWNEFVSLSALVLAHFINWIVWSWNMGIRSLWTNGKGTSCKYSIGCVRFFLLLFRDQIHSLSSYCSRNLGHIGGSIPFHLCVPPPQRLYKGLRMGGQYWNHPFLCCLFSSSCWNYVVWLGNYPPMEFFGPTRYQWDPGYFQQERYRRVRAGLAENQSVSYGIKWIPEKWAFYELRLKMGLQSESAFRFSSVKARFILSNTWKFGQRVDPLL